MIARVSSAALPFAVFIAALAFWEAVVRVWAIPPYILPGPLLIVQTLIADWSLLYGSLLVTLTITIEALAAAFTGGVLLAIVFAQSRLIERAVLPFAIILQVTPVVAIAPLLLVYLSAGAAVLVCAFLVAFFPILASASLGFASVDRNLSEFFKLQSATAWQRLRYLQWPSALPFLLSGLRVGGGLALIGAIVAELAAGAAGQGTGLAYRITEAGYRLNVPRMFAALALISATGIALNAAFGLLARLLLARWHESDREP